MSESNEEQELKTKVSHTDRQTLAFQELLPELNKQLLLSHSKYLGFSAACLGGSPVM